MTKDFGGSILPLLQSIVNRTRTKVGIQSMYFAGMSSLILQCNVIDVGPWALTLPRCTIMLILHAYFVAVETRQARVQLPRRVLLAGQRPYAAEACFPRREQKPEMDYQTGITFDLTCAAARWRWQRCSVH